MYQIINGDSLEILRELSPNSIDSLVTDPPSGISFMGKDWDGGKGGRDQWIAWLQAIMVECMRVLKPGGHGLVWALPRTAHWTGMALELAGFEIRDSIHHIFGTGFPKSLNVSKQIDKLAGVERPVVGSYDVPDITGDAYCVTNDKQATGHYKKRVQNITTAATDDAKKWDGFGSALKPGHEVWWLVRKPLEEKGIARQVLATGTGALNIDGGRVGDEVRHNPSCHNDGTTATPIMVAGGETEGRITKGRFPPNILFTHNHDCTEVCSEGCPVAELGAQSGVKNAKSSMRGTSSHKNCYGIYTTPDSIRGHTDKGTASRFFPIFRYQAKPSTRERNAGITTDEKQKVFNGQSDHSASKAPGSLEECFTPKPARNHHPTVKSIELMRWLVRLVTPPNGIVLDPFCGSGSTGCAAIIEGFDFVGIELSEEYRDLALQRIEYWASLDDPAAVLAGVLKDAPTEDDQLPGQGRLF